MCRSPNIVTLRWAGHVATSRTVEDRSAFKILTEKSTGKRPLEEEALMGGQCYKQVLSTGNLVDSSQDRDYCGALVNATLNLWVA